MCTNLLADKIKKRNNARKIISISRFKEIHQMAYSLFYIIYTTTIRVTERCTVYCLLFTVIFVATYNLSYSQALRENPDPFIYGVASGDPMPNKIIIWTKINTPTLKPVTVNWIIAKDINMKLIVKSGEIKTDSTKDYTVKVDVTGLLPSTVYYYRFQFANMSSIIGVTKTAPIGNVSSVNFAIVSCSNYGEGYFSALARIAERSNLDAVIHLGDYIYEGTERDFEIRSKEMLKSIPNEASITKTKEEWLTYYRARYAITRLDSDMRSAHQKHAFITVWDDHETADNAYANGASGHNPKVDGSWSDRKLAAIQAYFEWMPIRGEGNSIYRSLKYGNLLELILLDTRLEGRDIQIYDASSPELHSNKRKLLGNVQKMWLLDKLKTSKAQWKVIANQVIFSEFNVGWAKVGPFASQFEQLESNILDYWQGYPAERESIVKFLDKEAIDNVVILSASMHCSLAFDVSLNPTSSMKAEKSEYDPLTGKGSVAVEFATPSISSANFDEKIGSTISNAFESKINQKLPSPFGFNPNPHLKFVDLDEHGYFILEISKQKAQANWFFVNNKLDSNSKERFAEAWYTLDKANHLEKESK